MQELSGRVPYTLDAVHLAADRIKQNVQNFGDPEFGNLEFRDLKFKDLKDSIDHLISLAEQDLVDPQDPKEFRLRACLDVLKRRTDSCNELIGSPEQNQKFKAELAELKRFLRIAYRARGAFLCASDWQSPAYLSTFPGSTNRINKGISERFWNYKRDGHLEALSFEEDFIKEYLPSQNSADCRSYLMNSEIAAFSTVMHWCAQEQDSTSKLLAISSSATKFFGLIRSFFPKAIELRQDASLSLAGILKKEKPGTVFISGRGKSQSYLLTCMDAVIEYARRNEEHKLAAIVEIGAMTSASLPAELMSNRPANLLILVVENLEYHQFGIDAINGGIVVALMEADMQESFKKARALLGTNISDSSVGALPRPDHGRLSARLQRVKQENATRSVVSLRRPAIEASVFAGEEALQNYLCPSSYAPTPLVELPSDLNPFRQDGVRLFAKMMSLVPLMNIKSIPAYSMLNKAYERGDLDGVENVIESSSSNTVLSLSVMARLFGIEKTSAIVDHSIAPSLTRMLRLFGIDILLHPAAGHELFGKMQPRSERAFKMGQQDGWLNPGQYTNPDNPEGFAKWLAPDLWEQTGGRLGLLACALGTCGTMVGVSRGLRAINPDIKVLAVCPQAGHAVPGPREKSLLADVSFEWQNIPTASVELETKESFIASIKLLRRGIMAGPSSGMNYAGTLRYLQQEKESGRLSQMLDAQGELVTAFLCCDSPLPHVDEYYDALGEDYFPSVQAVPSLNAESAVK